jgi:hypothetical protein
VGRQQEWESKRTTAVALAVARALGAGGRAASAGAADSALLGSLGLESVGDDLVGEVEVLAGRAMEKGQVSAHEGGRHTEVGRERGQRQQRTGGR